jgi:carboxyl-terminal processing protease
MRRIFVLFIISNIYLQVAQAKPAGDTSSLVCIQVASRQLDEALALMQKHYYKKDEVRWDSLIAAAKNRLASSGSCEDALQTVNWCFSQIKETHSFILPTAAAALYNYDTAYLQKKPRLSQLMGEIKSELMVDEGIAYISVPWIATTDSLICNQIADSLQQVIARLDKPGISKWIVDLRKNSGGNCWPMIAGIGPLVGEGVCGYFISGEEKVPFSYQQGASLQGRYVRCRVRGSGYKTRKDKKWIIVLTGPKTSSSGEIVTLAFKGRDQVLQYGEPTAGYTTANTTYTLSDKSMLVLTVSTEADRTGRVYEGKILPDEIIPSATISEFDDPAKSAAIMWLNIQ